ncbi:MAG TPA: AsmA family protein [Caulobacteraceae bacterium]|nr:AsmA family protein [Caulobacteraceae bacterium]
MDSIEQIAALAKLLGRRVGRAQTIFGGLALVGLGATLLFLARENWNFLRGPIAGVASARTGRAVRLDGDLTAHLLSWTPEFRIGGLKIGKPNWAGPGDVADVQSARLQLRLLPLLVGQVELPLVELKGMRLDLLRDKTGRESWALDAKSAGQPFKLPLISRFLITDGRVRLVDQTRKIVLNGQVQANERPISADGRGFSLTGDGTLNSEKFQLTATGGPLIGIKRDRPYPFRLDVQAGATHALASGQILRPFDMGGLTGALTINGPDLARLYDLTAITLPNTPPYTLSAQFERHGARYGFTHIAGKVGASDLGGDMTIDKVQGRRRMTADLVSEHLNFPDLLALLGGPPARTAPSPAPAKRAQISLPMSRKPAAAARSADHRLLPDAPLIRDRLGAMDADVRFRANSIRGGAFTARRGSLTLKLQNSVMTIDPLDVEFAQGRLSGHIGIDARTASVRTDADVTLANIGLQGFLRSTGPQPPVEGLMQARARLTGVGDSVHKAASTANGQVVFVVPHGRIRQSFAELLGVNVGRGLFLLLSKDPRQTDMRCAVAQFDVKGGVMTARQVVIDTGVVTSTGSGSIDLGAERLNLDLKGQTKHPELLRIWTPIQIRGTFNKPTVGLDAGSVAAQGGLALGVAALLGPLTAILPFVSPGLAKDADCAGLMVDAKHAGAPVKGIKASALGHLSPSSGPRTQPRTAPQHGHSTK